MATFMHSVMQHKTFAITGLIFLCVENLYGENTENQSLLLQSSTIQTIPLIEQHLYKKNKINKHYCNSVNVVDMM